MQFNPGRSWAVTYGHMWNLSMREPLQSKQQFKSGVNFGHSSNSIGNNGGKTANMVKKKYDYCWNFNKGMKCRFRKNCRFIERCSYCDGSSHGVVNCPKLHKKETDHHHHRDKGISKWDQHKKSD